MIADSNDTRVDLHSLPETNATVVQSTPLLAPDSNGTVVSFRIEDDRNVTANVLAVAGEGNVSGISAPGGGDISVTLDGALYQCSKADLIAEDVNGTRVYHCPTVAVKQLESATDERGTAETQRLKAELKAKTQGEEKIVLVENNESTEGKQWLLLEYTEEVVKTVFPARLYLSLRYGARYEDGAFRLVDGGTRGGFFYYHQFANDLEFSYHVEAGVTFSGLDQVFGTDTQSDYIGLTPRLNYVSLKQAFLTTIIGKYWSTYYDIAGMTDKFIVFGAQGDGVYNAGTDGGGSGTGRASNLLQVRVSKSDFNLGLQVQAHQTPFRLPFDEDVYDYCFGGSFFYKGLSSGVKVGIAANYATFQDREAMAPLGVKGEDHAYVGGLAYQKDDLSLDVTGAYTQNHVTDNAGFYFNSLGSELYARYRVNDAVRTAFGYNYLRPVDEEYTGEYHVKDLIASLQYAFDTGFDDMVYIEGRYSKGHQADGSRTPSVIAAGFRYLLDY